MIVGTEGKKKPGPEPRQSENLADWAPKRTIPAATTSHPAGHSTDRWRSSPGPYQTGTDCPRRLWQPSHWTVLSPGSARSCKHQLKVPIPLPTSLSTTTTTQIFATSLEATGSSTKWCWPLYWGRSRRRRRRLVDIFIEGFPHIQTVQHGVRYHVPVNDILMSWRWCNFVTRHFDTWHFHSLLLPTKSITMWWKSSWCS